jgi:hypothetical protein
MGDAKGCDVWSQGLKCPHHFPTTTNVSSFAIVPVPKAIVSQPGSSIRSSSAANYKSDSHSLSYTERCGGCIGLYGPCQTIDQSVKICTSAVKNITCASGREHTLRAYMITTDLSQGTSTASKTSRHQHLRKPLESGVVLHVSIVF